MLIVKECPTVSSYDKDQWIRPECLCAVIGEKPSQK